MATLPQEEQSNVQTNDRRNGSTRPILVTGSHRSGTTWVGRTLAKAPGILYLHEVTHPRTDWTPTMARENPIRVWYPYVHEGNASQYRRYFDEVQGLRFPPPSVWFSKWYRSHPKGALKRFFGTLKNKISPARPLLKEPLGLFSAEWLASTYGMDVVATIRHPAAFVESLVRLDWRMDFAELERQPRLVEDLFPELAGRIHDLASRESSMLENASFQWVMIYDLIRRYQDIHPEWIYIRHEDLSRRPVEGFQELFEKLGLDYTSDARAFVEESTASSNPVSTENPLAIRRDSKGTVAKWKKLLEESEIEYIRNTVEPLASHFYSSDEW